MLRRSSQSQESIDSDNNTTHPNINLLQDGYLVRALQISFGDEFWKKLHKYFEGAKKPTLKVLQSRTLELFKAGDIIIDKQFKIKVTDRIKGATDYINKLSTGTSNQINDLTIISTSDEICTGKNSPGKRSKKRLKTKPKSPLASLSHSQSHGSSRDSSSSENEIRLDKKHAVNSKSPIMSKNKHVKLKKPCREDFRMNKRTYSKINDEDDEEIVDLSDDDNRPSLNTGFAMTSPKSVR